MRLSAFWTLRVNILTFALIITCHEILPSGGCQRGLVISLRKTVDGAPSTPATVAFNSAYCRMPVSRAPVLPDANCSRASRNRYRYCDGFAPAGTNASVGVVGTRTPVPTGAPH